MAWPGDNIFIIIFVDMCLSASFFFQKREDVDVVDRKDSFSRLGAMDMITISTTLTSDNTW